ncbi:MAG: leucine-rich repeat protein [Oscillospiraceae bacterium]
MEKCPNCDTPNPFFEGVRTDDPGLSDIRELNKRIKSGDVGQEQRKRRKTVSAIVSIAAIFAVAAAALFIFVPQAGIGFEYESVNGDHCVITKYTGTTADVTVPDTIWFRPVTVISESAFQPKNSGTDITRVKLGKNIIAIGEKAFKDCHLLEELDCSAVEMKDGSNFLIMNAAFEGCNNLKKVTLPDSGISIGVRAFADCTALEEIVTFDHNSNGYSAAIGVFGKKNMIEAQAFQNCTALKSLALEYANLGSSAFAGCTGLTELWMDGGTLNETGASSGTFKVCSELKSAQLFFSSFSERNTSIPRECFADCYSLESVSGSDVSEIGELAFRYCRSLSDISFDPYPSDIANNSFEGCIKLTQYGLASDDTKSDEQQQNTKKNKLAQHSVMEIKNSYNNYVSEYGMPDEYNNGIAIYNVGNTRYYVHYKGNFNPDSTDIIYKLGVYGGTDVDITNGMHLGESLDYYKSMADKLAYFHGRADGSDVYLGEDDNGRACYVFVMYQISAVEIDIFFDIDTMIAYGVQRNLYY